MRNFLLMVSVAFSIICAKAQDADFETASEAVKNMKVGWNLGNTLDANNGARMTDIVQSETYWGQPVTKPELMTMMRNAGFNAIRVPVTWFPHMDNNGKVDAAWMNRVHEVVDYVINAGMYCILNVHHDTGDGSVHWLHASSEVYNQQKARYEYLWKQIAEEFKDYGNLLLFESYNEMLDKYNSWCFATYARSSGYNESEANDAYQAINSFAQSFVNVVRATGGNNAKRNLVVNTYGACCGSGTWNSHLKDPLKQMNIPDDPAGTGHIAFEVHCYPNVKNLSSMRTEVDDMFNALKTHLISKGAPVIIGEWGTANDKESDYDVRRENVLSFADYFVKKAKENNVATVYWMGLSDGPLRSLPAFNQPDLAESIVKAYYGDSYSPVLPSIDDYTIEYTVTYQQQWSEMNLYGKAFSLNEYTGIVLDLKDSPGTDNLSIKVYGESNGKEQYVNVTNTHTKVTFNASALGNTGQRITLQYKKSGNYTATVKRAALIKKDGTEMPTEMSSFWGCTVNMNYTLGVPEVHFTQKTDDEIYTLSGMRVTDPGKGIYIRNGKKYVVR